MIDSHRISGQSSRGHLLTRGGVVGVLAGGVATILALTLLIPTNEFRARMWLLLQNSSDFSLQVALLIAFSLVGFAVLAGLRNWRAPSALGVVLGAALQVAALSSGAYRWVPEFQSVPLRAVVSLTVILLAAVILWRERRSLPDAGARDTPERVMPGDAEGWHTPPTVPWQGDHDRTV